MTICFSVASNLECATVGSVCFEGYSARSIPQLTVMDLLVVCVYLQGGVLQVRTVNSANDSDLVCAVVISY
jgi:hypothetical protein